MYNQKKGEDKVMFFNALDFAFSFRFGEQRRDEKRTEGKRREEKIREETEIYIHIHARTTKEQTEKE